MSTIPETTIAASIGLRVIGLSLITNLAAGCDVAGTQLSHHEVMEAGVVAMKRFRPFVEDLIANLPLPAAPEPIVAPAPAGVVSLAGPVAAAPTAASAAYVAQRITASLGAISAAVFAVDIDVPTDGKVVSVATLLGPAAQSLAARQAVVSKSGDVAVVVTASLPRNEAALLALGLRCAGAQAVFAVFPASGATAAAVGTALVPVRQLLSSPMHVPRRAPAELCGGGVTALLNVTASDPTAVSVMSFAGPEPPTPAERALAAFLGNTHVAASALYVMFCFLFSCCRSDCFC
jgi:hypothetical protein